MVLGAAEKTFRLVCRLGEQGPNFMWVETGISKDVAFGKESFQPHGSPLHQVRVSGCLADRDGG